MESINNLKNREKDINSYKHINLANKLSKNYNDEVNRIVSILYGKYIVVIIFYIITAMLGFVILCWYIRRIKCKFW